MWADRVACYILMGLWSIFVITYTIIFIISRNRELREFDAVRVVQLSLCDSNRRMLSHPRGCV